MTQVVAPTAFFFPHSVNLQREMTESDLVCASCPQLQSSRPAALQKPGAAPRETHVRHRGDGGIWTGVTQETRHKAKREQIIPRDSFCYYY